uniref:Uncharacterized protein n=1 Tax=Inoviridae sp. ctS4A1 TaxID=2825781 RepID=A0A8S5RTG1_9VIRU|nr:MAG TPA: hypothetical protein [Inoviridae sp. ctS4A1]
MESIFNHSVGAIKDLLMPVLPYVVPLAVIAFVGKLVGVGK